MNGAKTAPAPIYGGFVCSARPIHGRVLHQRVWCSRHRFQAAVLAGTLVFAALGRIAQRPLRLFQRIAGVVLLLYSAVPVLALKLAPDVFPGIDVKAVWTMEVMHLVAGAITVGLFTKLANPDTQASGGR